MSPRPLPDIGRLLTGSLGSGPGAVPTQTVADLIRGLDEAKAERTAYFVKTVLIIW